VLNWQSLDPNRVERGVQMLLRSKYAGLQSLDGAGGDGGRDAQLVTADGRTVFEVKSFGRLNSSRRRQIEKSLRKAVESALDMNRWVLVIPMNRTPARPGARSSEEVWFADTLPKLAPGVELSWWGLDWLDGQVAENMAFQRYIEGVDGQLLERAREFNLEQAVMAGGADDVRSRIETIARRADEISMFWTLDVAVRGGVTQTSLRAKVPDAHIIDPIKITPTFRFCTDDPDDERLRQRFEQTLAFGGSVDLPAGYVTDLEIEASDEARLLFSTGDPKDSGFTLMSERVPVERPIRCAYQVLDADERVISEFHVYLRERTSGAEGATLYGSDAASIATFEVSVPRPTSIPGPGESVEMGEGRLHLDLPDSIVGYDIDSLLPVTRTFAAATEERYIRFNMPGLGNLGGPVKSTQFPYAEETLELVSDLHRMQEVTGSVLRFPDNVTVGDAVDLRNAVRQLDGEEIEHNGGLSLNVRPEAVGEFLATWAKAPDGETAGGFLAASEGWELGVGDLSLLYGPVAFWAPHPRLANRAELEAIAADTTVDGPVVAQLEPTDAPLRWVSRERAQEYLDAKIGAAEFNAPAESPKELSGPSAEASQ
jgi:hypothetical protein